MQPVRGVEPQVGTRVAFDVNDQGRQAMGGTMGPEIAQVEGVLLEKENGGYRLSVRAVRLLRGGEQFWSGEEVRLRTEHLGPAYERRFSAGRSVAFVAVGVGGIGAFLVSRSLLGSGTDDDGGTHADHYRNSPALHLLTYGNRRLTIASHTAAAFPNFTKEKA